MQNSNKPNKVIYETIFGSHLYGLNTAQSDLDMKAIYIPHKRDIVLGRTKLVINTSTGDNVNKNSSEDIDWEYYTLQKFVKLLLEGQTVALDMLFASPSVKGDMHPVWQELWDNRDRFRSRQCASFIGYCRQQANKYGIKGSRVAAARKIVETLKYLVDYGVGKRKLEVYNEQWLSMSAEDEFINIIPLTSKSGVTLNHLEVCNRKAQYTLTVDRALEMYTILLDNYGKRALEAENNEGVDWKALSHAVRIGQQSIEYLNTGEFTFPRPNKKELLDIKLGKCEYRDVALQIEKLLEDVEDAALVSGLPKEPDYEWAEDFVYRIYENEIKTT